MLSRPDWFVQPPEGEGARGEQLPRLSRDPGLQHADAPAARKLPGLRRQPVAGLCAFQEAERAVDGDRHGAVSRHGGAAGGVRQGEVHAAVGDLEGVQILLRHRLDGPGIAGAELLHINAQPLAEEGLFVAERADLLIVHGSRLLCGRWKIGQTYCRMVNCRPSERTLPSSRRRFSSRIMALRSVAM